MGNSPNPSRDRDAAVLRYSRKVIKQSRELLSTTDPLVAYLRHPEGVTERPKSAEPVSALPAGTGSSRPPPPQP